MDYILLTGADIGEKQKTLELAAQSIEANIGEIVKRSSFHESAPWGFEADTTFLNQAVLVNTGLNPETMLSELQKIEVELGRIRKDTQWISRAIDIDILCSEKLIHQSSSLTIPHIHLHEREFALKPLCELVPNWQHPLLQKSYSDLLAELRFEPATL